MAEQRLAGGEGVRIRARPDPDFGFSARAVRALPDAETTPPADHAQMFENVMCGVDGSPASLVAVRQAAKLVHPSGRLLLVGVANVAVAVQAGMAASAVWEDIEAEAQATLAAAHREAPTAETMLFDGRPGDVLLRAAREESADVVAVGTHGGSRAKGILLGSVATLMLHEAPCSVLVSRPSGAKAFPRSICVGVDGSPSSVRAASVARKLTHRFSAELTIIGACGGTKLDLEAVRSVAPTIEVDSRPPVDALIGRAEEAPADLLVLGSRGLHGVAALGSVSERVAHRATCSVLVVREREAADGESHLADRVAREGDAEP